MNGLKINANRLKYLSYLVMTFVIVTYSFSINVLLGVGVIVLTLAILGYIMRGDILAIIARYIYNDDHGKGFLWYERALKTDKMRPVNILVYAYLLIREGVLDKSEQLINKTLFIEKDNLNFELVSGAHINLSIIKWKRGDLAGAISEIEEVYESGYRSSVMYGTLGCYYLLNGQWSKALEFNKEGYEFNSSDKIIRDNLGYNYYLCGNIIAAEEIYEELIEENPTFLEPYYNYGKVLEVQGSYEAAMENYEKALDIEVKFLSTISHSQVQEAIDNLRERLNSEKESDNQ